MKRRVNGVRRVALLRARPALRVGVASRFLAGRAALSAGHEKRSCPGRLEHQGRLGIGVPVVGNVRRLDHEIPRPRITHDERCLASGGGARRRERPVALRGRSQTDNLVTDGARSILGGGQIVVDEGASHSGGRVELRLRQRIEVRPMGKARNEAGEARRIHRARRRIAREGGALRDVWAARSGILWSR